MAAVLFKTGQRLAELSVFAVLLLVFLSGVYTVYDEIQIYAHASPSYVQRLRRTKETDEGGLPSGYTAWLKLEGTAVNYPVMQGKDNAEYLNKDPFGEYSVSGSLFLDYRNNAEFKDAYSLIYGHHMEGNAMFGSLDQYRDPSFFNVHTEGTLEVKDKTYDLYIYAVMDADASDETIFEFGNEDSREQYIRNHSFLYREAEGETILAMSTCRAPDSQERTVVFARMKERR